ncbi:MAG: AMP-binding protein [Clostridia bacterium]|nr:AMP-binding protein [Clostridia bacterium]
MDKLEQNAEKYPERTAVTLDFGEAPVTYSELWNRSGRIYGALKARGIGREDTVMLFLPRHPMMIVALLGVLRAGAAVTLAEDTCPEERLAYMKADCGVRFVIDRDFYEKAQEGPSLSGREPLYPHDAGMIFYTSGTTGKPKGILHEYGKIDIGIAGTVTDEDAVDFDRCDRFAFVPPFNFSAVMIHGLPELYTANTLYILSYHVSKNFKRLRELLEKERITGLFLSPSVLRVYNEGFPYVRSIMTGSEPASRLCIPGHEITVHYAMTESLYCVSKYVLTQESTDAPIATRDTGRNIRILGEDGTPVKDGETGEICFPDPYFRGYINMPEKTREVFRDGLFHSGDLGYRSENEDIFIKGRADDMIKINGNRIEPGEIEAAAREVSGIGNVVAKGFVSDRRSYVALYYPAKEADETCLFRDAALARRRLSEKLPSYMIPSYFVPIETMPLNANGKLSRSLLPEPAAATETGEPRRKPADETEALLCRVMASVLPGAEPGPDDDFYEAGGDSISAIRMVTACSAEGCDITVEDLLEARTAAALARRISGRRTATREETALREDRARRKPQRLLAGQRIYWQLFEKYPDHPSVCVPVFAILKNDTDPERLKNAVNRVIARHPALLSGFRREKDGSVVQYYDETLFQPVTVEEMSAAELARERVSFFKPVNLLKDRLYSARIIRTPEKNVFLLSVHHIMGDGASNSMLLHQIAACYRDPEAVLPPDLYYSLCEEEAAESGPAEKAGPNPAERLPEKSAAMLRPDLPGPDSGSETLFLQGVLPRSPKASAAVFLTAGLTATAEINGCDSALIYATYNGRNRQARKDAAGCFTVLLPVAVTKIREKKAEELISEVRKQLDHGMLHAAGSPVTESGLPLDRTVVFNYQYGTMDFGDFSNLAESVFMPRRDPNSPNCLFNIGVLDRADAERLDFYCNYPRGMYLPETVRRFGECFVKAAGLLTAENPED